MELGIIKNNGDWITEEEFIDKFRKIIEEGANQIKERLENAPSYIKEKVKEYRFAKVEKKGFSFQIVYTLYDREITVDIISRDPNISRTFILEIATPPCTYLEELTWWVHNLIKAVNVAIRATTPYILIAVGLNPLQKYSVGLSYGEHHHLGIADIQERIAIYNMIRNYVPHLIAVSVNSPLEDGRPTDDYIKVSEKGYLIAPKCIRSIRLLKNDHQLGPASPFNYVPFLKWADKEKFIETTQRKKEGGRLVDIYPFTRHQTLEIRFFDTQFTVSRVISIALLLEAIALKAKKIFQEKGIDGIPEVSSEVIVRNREEAISLGLQGAFHEDKKLEEKDTKFAEIYNTQFWNKDRKVNRYLNDAVISLIFFLKEELVRLNFFENPITQSFLASIFGTNLSPPMYSPADIILRKYIETNSDKIALLEFLEEITAKSCDNVLYDPLQGTPNIPIELLPEKALELTISSDEYIFSHKMVPATITVKNNSDIMTFRDLNLICRIENERGEVIKKIEKNITSLSKNETMDIQIEFYAEKGARNFNIIVTLHVRNSKIIATKSIQVYKLDTRIATEIFATEPDTPIDFYGEIKNESPLDINAIVKLIVLNENKMQAVAYIEKKLDIKAKSKIKISPRTLGTLVVDKIDPEMINDTYKLLLEVYDIEGKKLAAAESGKFLIFVRPPEVDIVQINQETPILSPLKNRYSLGERLFFNFLMVPKGYFPEKKITLRINFIAEKSGTIKVYENEFEVNNEEEIPVALSWKIPHNLILPEYEDSIYFEIAVISSGKIVGYFETSKAILQKELPNVKITVDIPRLVEQKEEIMGHLFIDILSEFKEKGMYVAKILNPQDNTEIALDKGIITGKTSLVIELGPIAMNFSEGYVELIIEVYEGKKKIAEHIVPILIKKKTKEILKHILIEQVNKEVEPASILAIPCKILWNSSDTEIQLIAKIFSPTIGTISESKENVHVKRGENFRIIKVPLPISLEAEEYCTLEVSIYSGELKIDFTQKQLKIRKPVNPIFKVELDVLTEDNLPVPDIVDYATELQLAPRITSYSKLDEKIQLIVLVGFSPGKVYKIEYKPIVIPKGKEVTLKSIKLKPEIKSPLTKVEIKGALYQRGVKLKSVEIEEKVFFITVNV